MKQTCAMARNVKTDHRRLWYRRHRTGAWWRIAQRAMRAILRTHRNPRWKEAV